MNIAPEIRGHRNEDRNVHGGLRRGCAPVHHSIRFQIDLLSIRLEGKLK